MDNAIKATPDEVSKYMQFQDVNLATSKRDVFSDGGWWQGIPSPILTNGTTIVSIHGGRVKSGHWCSKQIYL